MGHATVHRLSARRGDLIVPSDRDQRRHRNLTEAIDAIPVFQIADHDELVRATHRLVDCIACDVARGASERLWPWVETAEVSLVKFQHGGFIVGMVEIASRLIALQGVIDSWR